MRETTITFLPDSRLADISTGDKQLLEEIKQCKRAGEIRIIHEYRDGSKDIQLPRELVHISVGKKDSD